MEFIDLPQEVDRLVKVGEPEKAGIVEAIHEIWPEARGFWGPWGVFSFACKGANPEVDQIEMVRDVTLLEIYPFTSVGGSDRLYSDPPRFVVARSSPRMFGYRPLEGWTQKMVDSGVSERIIDLVSDFLKRHPPISY